MMVVSLSSEPNAVGAVGTCSPYISLITNLFIGFSVGANVIIARHIGSKSREEAERATHTSVVLGTVIGIVLGAIGIALAEPVLRLIGNTGNVLELATMYTQIYCMGVPFIALTNVLVAILRAKGDSKTPLIVLSISGLLNVLFNLFFVLVLGYSVEGVALATVIANVFSFIVLLIKLKNAGEYVGLSFKKLKIHKRAARDIFSVGIPSGIQGALFAISNLLIVSSIVALDVKLSPDPNFSPVLNGNAAQLNIDAFIYTAMSAVCQATATYVSQNYGANNRERIKKGFFLSYLLVGLTGITVSSITLIFRKQLLSLYGVVEGPVGSVDAIAYETAVTRSLIVGAIYFICGLMEVGTTTIRSVGKPVASFLITFFGVCVFRVVWTLAIFPIWETLVSLYVAFPISWFLSAVIAFIITMHALTKMKKKRKIV